MSERKIENVLKGLSPAMKKDVLDNLVFALLSELSESDRKEMLNAALAGRKDNQRLVSMVEH